MVVNVKHRLRESVRIGGPLGSGRTEGRESRVNRRRRADMAGLRKEFKTGTQYTVSKSGLKARITYCGKFKGLKRSGAGKEEFVVFRLEPHRFIRKAK